MVKIALKKILKKMLSDEYPKILDIVINHSDLGSLQLFMVGIGMKYEDSLKMKDSDIDTLITKIKNLSKYIFSSQNEKIDSVYFYDPEQY